MNGVLKKVNLFDFVSSLGGLDYKLEEGASNLSGGQRQRLALARSLLLDPKVYIFDEATSNIDCESEEQIMSVVKNLSKEKIVVLISHRLANVVDSNQIYFLKDGTIAERGTHSELMDKNGEYARLFNQQKELEESWNR